MKVNKADFLEVLLLIIKAGRFRQFDEKMTACDSGWWKQIREAVNND